VETDQQHRGTCRYVGHVKELSNGIFVGLELDESIGDQGGDGSIRGTTYFECDDGHGQFVLIEQCRKLGFAASTNTMISNFDSNQSGSSAQSASPNPRIHSIHHQPNGYPPPNMNTNPSSSTSNGSNININPTHSGMIGNGTESSNGHMMRSAHPGINDNMSMDINFVDLQELDMDDARNKLNRALSRRKSQHDLMRHGVVPQNYFNDPITVSRQQSWNHRAVHSTLDEWLPQRHSKEWLQQRNIVPVNYFVDPLAASNGQKLVKEMISEHLEEFHGRRPTLHDLQRKNIMPPEFALPTMDHQEAANLQMERFQERKKVLNEKLTHPRRPTITDLGDMHIIPHDYLDNLLEEAVNGHQRKQSRMDHVQNRLQKHLPETVAHTLAETLVTSVQEEVDEQGQTTRNGMYADGAGSTSSSSSSSSNTSESGGSEEREDEYEITFVWEKINDFVKMDPDERENVGQTLQRRLSLRPTPHQIEVLGIVPPQYFENAEQSFFQQALGREVAMDLLDTFFPRRENVNNLMSRGILHPYFLTQDYDVAYSQQQQEKQLMMDNLNGKLNPNRRPSIHDIADQGYIPDNYIEELYELADDVRKKHRRMESAVDDLKSKLNVPPILGEVVARDCLEQLEAFSPELLPAGMEPPMESNMEIRGDLNSNVVIQEVDDDEERPSGRRGSNEEDQSVWWRHQIETLRREIAGKEETIGALRTKNGNLEQEMERMKEAERGHLVMISNLEEKTAAIRDQTEEMNSLREQQSSIELDRLDSAAIEMELSRERMKTEQLMEEKKEIESELSAEKGRVSEMEQRLQKYEEQKVELLGRANEQMNQLREYLLFYQRYFNEQRARKEEREREQQEREREQQRSPMKAVFGNLFG